MRYSLQTAALAALAFAGSASAAISVSGLVDKRKYDDSVTFTVSADPDATTTTAELDGIPIAVGTAVTVTDIRYHELWVESRDGSDGVVDSERIRFIVRAEEERGDSESGIPVFTPLRTVNDAPAAFANLDLELVAPSSWPVGHPVPLAFKLVGGDGEIVLLNGVVTLAGFPGTTVQIRRGWGSVVAPPVEATGSLEVGAVLHGLTASSAIQIGGGPEFVEVSGTISTDTTWGAGSRIRVTDELTVESGATLTVEAGSVIQVDVGDGARGSAAEIVVEGALAVTGTAVSPVAFVPSEPGGHWGGIELPDTGSRVTVEHSLFHGAGEDPDWFDNDGGYGGGSHRDEQALFLVVGSGSGSETGAELHLADCYVFDLAGQMMNSKNRNWIDLSRTLVQRCSTGGQLNQSRVTIDRCAFLEFPGESEEFVDDDNDGLYLTAGDLSITNTVIAFTKDDGIDSGGSGGESPFGTVDPDAGTTTTRFYQENNWYEGSVHEGNSLSGARNVYYHDCVFLNNGQGVEAGYSSGSNLDGPNAIVEGCLFVNNMVGVRWGDNYGSGYTYNQTLQVEDSLVLSSFYRDAFSGQWHPTQANAWIYQTTDTNSLGIPYFILRDSLLSQPDPENHPDAGAWDGTDAGHAAMLDAFMPVPGSDVGVAVSTYQGQLPTTGYPDQHTIRLSSFSSKPVAVAWKVVGKMDAFDGHGDVLASGSLSFPPGQTVRTIDAPVTDPGSYGLIHVALSDPTNAEVTGEAFFIDPGASAPTSTPIAFGSDGWRYREERSDPSADWASVGFDDSSPAATGWQAAVLPAGYGGGGAASGTTVESGPSGDRTKAFYFRKQFIVDDVTAIAGATLRLRRDDAAAIWFNGAATPAIVSADGSWNPPYTYDNRPPNSSSSSQVLEYEISPSLLVEGENLIAIQVGQTSATSSDLLIDCELVVEREVGLELHQTWSQGRPIFWWFDANAYLESSDNLSDWRPAPQAASPVTVDPAGETTFLRLRR